MLTKYFESKIGDTITKNMVTGETFYTDVYERVYKFEILAVDNDKVLLATQSYDKAPSGARFANTDNYFGEQTVDLTNFTSRDEILEKLIEQVDSAFWNKYATKVQLFAAKQKQKV